MPTILYSIKDLNALLKKQRGSSVCVVTSKRLGVKLDRVIKEISVPKDILFLPDGERAKDWKQIEKLLKSFIELNLDRDAIVIALGGGSIGDAVGFATAIYLRGIRYIQVPTTLLAQADSSHGGKTSINFLNYKNQIGSFHQPIATVVDIRLLKSLSEEQVIDGLGEVIKAGLIKDASILELLRKERISTLLTSHSLQAIIHKAINVKKYYITKDPRDIGIRQILNAGHTIGHAIELKYGISHGRAVILGILAELEIAESLRLTPRSVRSKLAKLLSFLGIDTDQKYKPNWKTILHDKKIRGGSITFPIIKKEGEARLIPLDLKRLKSK